MFKFKLRFPKSKLKHWARRYPIHKDDEVLELSATARKRGWLTTREFLKLGEWKTSRSRALRERNADALIRETTRVAFAAENEQLKIGVLRLLDGVAWPTASVLLHLCDTGKYPILDVRALWSVGRRGKVSYSFEFWLRYTQFVRGLAGSTGCTMREVDRALWQYSRERQPDA